MNGRELLLEARHLLVEKGWTQSVFYQEDEEGHPTCFCLDGALEHVLAMGTDEYQGCFQYPEYQEALKLLGVERVEDIWDANDAPGQTKEGILRWIDEAVS